MSDDSELLASAYLDGDVTPDERARVEADPALLAQVESMRAAGVELRSVDALTAERADALIAQALAGRATGRLVPIPARRHARRWLAVAAAVVAVGAAGVVVATALDGADEGGDESAAVFDVDDAATLDTGAAGGADVAGTEARTESAEAPAAPFATQTPTELAADAGSEEPEPGAGTAAPAAAADSYSPRYAVMLVGPDELADFAASAPEPDVPAPSASTCTPEPDQRVVGTGSYAAVAGGVQRDVVVVVDDEAGVVSALDATTCQPVATVPLD